MHFQRGMDFALDRLREGSWLHLYPEGKVNVAQTYLRYKWGVGRLLSECLPTPIVIPIYHLGMDRVLPNRKPYIPHFGQRVTICVGEPIRLEDTLRELDERKADEVERRRTLTAVIQAEMEKLRLRAEILHAKHQCSY